MPKLTDLTIKNATEGIMWDDTVRGLGVRRGKNRTTFIVLVASGRRHRIGHYPEMTLADARKTAKEMLAEKTLGVIKPKQHAYEDAKKDFLATKANQPRTVKEYTRILNNHFPFGRKNLVDIQPRTIVQILNKIDKTSERHHSYVAAKVFFNWCVKQHILENSPMDHIDPPQKGKPRDRLLTTQELQMLCQHTREPNTPFLAIVRLLILTGARCNEIAHLEWSWIKDGSITVPNTKNKQPHTFPYGPGVQKVLDTLPRYHDCPYLFPAARTVSEKTTVFNGWSKSKAQLDRDTGITGYRLHDLRKSFSSGMAALGVPQIVVEKLLAHVTGGVQSSISRVYNLHHYMPEMREAILKWDAYIDKLSLP